MAITNHISLFLRGGLPGTQAASASLLRLRTALRLCLPQPVRQMLAVRDRRLLILPEGAGGHLVMATGDEREPIGHLSLEGSASLPRALSERAGDPRHRTVLMLPDDAVLTREVSFPAQVQGNLAQVIRYELDRLSPFRPEDVVYDFVIRSAPKQSSRLSIELALCRRDQVGPWVKRLAEAGSPVDQVSWERAWPGANLLPPNERPKRRRQLFSINKALAALAALLLVAIAVTPLWQKSRIIEGLDREVSRARAEAVAVDDLRQELERARLGSTAVLQQKWEEPPILDLLRELTERLPDDTWLQTLDYQDGRVEIRGESGQATALIALLEQGPGIEEVAFRSPVTQVVRTGKERFNIAFQYVPPRPQ